jgi:hypothetical protein
LVISNDFYFIGGFIVNKVIFCLSSILLLLVSFMAEARTLTVNLEWTSGSQATDLDLYVVNPKGEWCNWKNRNTDWGATHTRDDVGKAGKFSHESYTIDLNAMDCYASGKYTLYIHHYGGPSITSTISVPGVNSWNFTSSKDDFISTVYYSADQARCVTSQAPQSYVGRWKGKASKLSDNPASFGVDFNTVSIMATEIDFSITGNAIKGQWVMWSGNICFTYPCFDMLSPKLWSNFEGTCTFSDKMRCVVEDKERNSNTEIIGILQADASLAVEFTFSGKSEPFMVANKLEKKEAD